MCCAARHGTTQDGRLNDVWVLDTNTMHWSEAVCTGNPPSSRSGHTATMWGEWLVIFGGWDGDRHLKDTHMLNIGAALPRFVRLSWSWHLAV